MTDNVIHWNTMTPAERDAAVLRVIEPGRYEYIRSLVPVLTAHDHYLVPAGGELGIGSKVLVPRYSDDQCGWNEIIEVAERTGDAASISRDLEGVFIVRIGDVVVGGMSMPWCACIAILRHAGYTVEVEAND